VGRQKTRATKRSRGRTARRIRRYRHCVPAINFRRAFITIHCDDTINKGLAYGVVPVADPESDEIEIAERSANLSNKQACRNYRK
jgi:hypothetical protein